VNRQDKRAARVKDPKGHWIYPTLLRVLEYDEKGRPTHVRILYDDEKVGDVLENNDKCLMAWMHEKAGRLS
jgi:hypothetical protein